MKKSWKNLLGLTAETYSYLTTKMKIKKQKAQKMSWMYVMKSKFTVEDCKNCLEATQHLEKNEINIDSLKKDKKKLIKNNKLISKAQPRFKSERHNVLTEEINESSNDDKRMQSIDLIETFIYIE